MTTLLNTTNGAHGLESAAYLSPVEDFEFPQGWMAPGHAQARARQCCADLEEGKTLFFDRIPFDLPRSSREFLLSQREADPPLRKIISYRPQSDVLRGATGPSGEQSRLREIMRRFSSETARFLGQVLKPYASHWTLDEASFRPEEERGRELPARQRNDLLHLDALPSRPMQGQRILRCFTNINPGAARVWNTTDGFEALASRHAGEAGLARFAAEPEPRSNPVARYVKKMFGLPAADSSAYDRFMARFHDYLKENAEFQEHCRKTRLVFPPQSTWVCFTDAVPHAVLSGQYALEQAFIVPLEAMVKPESAPIRVLEKLAGTKLGRRSAV